MDLYARYLVRVCVCVMACNIGCVIVDTFSVKLQTNIEENEAVEASKMFIKPLDNIRNNSVHRDRSV